MGFQNQSGHFIIKRQTGGAVLPGGIGDLSTFDFSDGIAYRIKSGVAGPNRDLLVVDPEIGGNRDVTDAYLGSVIYSGEIDFFFRFQQIHQIFNAVLGQTMSTRGAGSNPYRHICKPSDTLPYWAIEQKIGSTFAIPRYGDVKFDSLHLECNANGYMTGTAGLLARYQFHNATDTAEATIIDQSPLATGAQVVITYNGVSVPAKTFTLDINNNVEDDDFRLGSFHVGELTEKRREVKLGFRLRPTDSALFRQAVYGSSAATAPTTGATTKTAVQVTITSFELIPGMPAYNYVTVLTIPRAIIAPFAVAPSGDDVIEYDIEMTAVMPINDDTASSNLGSTNLLAADNSTFETRNTGAFSGTDIVVSSGSAALNIVSSAVHSGTRALQAVSGDTNPFSLTWQPAAGGGYITGVVAGQMYAFNGWLTTGAGVRSYSIAIQWYDNANALISTTNGPPYHSSTTFPGSSTTYNMFEVTGIAPPNAVKARAVLNWTGNSSAGVSYRTDDVYFGPVKEVIIVDCFTDEINVGTN